MIVTTWRYMMKKVRWGILGAGGIADRRTLPGMALAKNAEIYAVMEVDPAFSEKLRAKYNAVKAYTDTDSLLADPNIDAVYIASPVKYHAEQVRKAAMAGKHILVEKPVAMTSEESNELCKFAAKAGVLMATGLMMRYHTYHQQMKKLIEEGRLGQIVSCRAQLTCWYPDIPGNWRQLKANAGGGAMTDMGIHCLDLLEYITGGKVTKVAGLYDTKTFHYDVEDSCSALFRLSNGAFGYVDANFNIPDEAAKCRLEIYGTKGSFLAEGTIGQVEGGDVLVTLSDDALGYNAQQERDKQGAAKMSGELGNMYTKEIESFGESILNGAAVQVPATDAARIQSVIESIYKSSDTGAFVSID